MSSKSSNRLIRGGQVIDGTGAPAILADVRVRDGQIVAVGPDLAAEPGEEVFDAAGCYVTPGFIESHTHYDGAMWWQSDLDPLPGYGVTTMVLGNCGFGLAPLPDDERIKMEVLKIFTFFEDFPEAPFLEHLPWDWQKWSEYKASMERNVRVPVNYATFVSHITLRLAVLGLEAWERAAKPEEVSQMAELLEDALAAGALGLASNLFDHDEQDRPVPTFHAEDEEFRRLFEVVAGHPGASFQIPVDNIIRMTSVQTVERIARIAEGLDIRVQWAGIPNEMWQKEIGIQAPLIALHEKFVEEGRDFWTGFLHAPITTSISIEHSLLFTQSGDFVWHEVVQATGDKAKRAILSDPDWRARARQSWDVDSNDTGPFRTPEPIILELSENGTGPVGLTLGEYAKELGTHCSDAMAEWFLRNGLESTVRMPDWQKDIETTVRLMRDPFTVGNISDAGAHGQMFCGAGDNILLLTEWAREKGLISLEEAVHVQTGKLSKHFGFLDRGEVAVGRRADLAVFNLNEIEHRPKHKVRDVPDGQGGMTWRWSREAAPVRLTLVGGVPTFAEGKPTGARPGTLLAPSAG